MRSKSSSGYTSNLKSHLSGLPTGTMSRMPIVISIGWSLLTVNVCQVFPATDFGCVLARSTCLPKYQPTVDVGACKANGRRKDGWEIYRSHTRESHPFLTTGGKVDGDSDIKVCIQSPDRDCIIVTSIPSFKMTGNKSRRAPFLMFRCWLGVRSGR